MPLSHIQFFSPVVYSSKLPFGVPFCTARPLSKRSCRRTSIIRMDSIKTSAKHGQKPEDVEGGDLSLKSTVLETGASMVQVRKPIDSVTGVRNQLLTDHQNFAPVKSICAHLNAFHAYADDPTRLVETNHYCAHLTEG